MAISQILFLPGGFEAAAESAFIFVPYRRIMQSQGLTCEAVQK
jgi:hypothetical protein